MDTIARAALLAGVLFASVLATGCAGPGRGGLEAFPFFEYHEDFDADRDGDGDGLHVTVPIAGFSWSGRVRELEHDGDGTGEPYEDPRGRRDMHIVHPFGSWQAEGGDADFRLMPFIPQIDQGLFQGGDDASRALPAVIYYSNREDEETGDDDWDAGFLPFILAGNDTSEGGYLTVAPFGGTMKGLWGKDEAVFIGWPFPLYIWMKDRGFESRHIMFPFVNRVEGDGHRGGRFFPFFAHYERDTKDGRLSYVRNWIMWPFITWQTNNIDTNPVDVFFLTPLFGRISSEEFTETTVLFPFFKYRTVRDPASWELRAPFPFIMISRGSTDWALPQGMTESRTDIWPLFGYKTRIYREASRETERWFALWPFVRREWEEDEEGRSSRFFALPFISSSARWLREDGEGLGDLKDEPEWSKFKLWPFFHNRDYSDGSTDIHALSPFWWEDEIDQGDGGERIYYPFFRLFHFHRAAPQGGATEGATTLRLLFGAYGGHHTPAQPELDIPEQERHSYLFGLFQYRRTGGERGIRFAWLPEISWGDVDDVEESSAADDDESPEVETTTPEGEPDPVSRAAPALDAPERAGLLGPRGPSRPRADHIAALRTRGGPSGLAVATRWAVVDDAPETVFWEPRRAANLSVTEIGDVGDDRPPPAGLATGTDR